MRDPNAMLYCVLCVLCVLCVVLLICVVLLLLIVVGIHSQTQTLSVSSFDDDAAVASKGKRQVAASTNHQSDTQKNS